MKEIKILKPLYGHYVCIRESYLLSGPRMKVTIPQGSAVIDTKEWIKTGKLMEKVYLYDNRPMRLWCNTLPVEFKDDEAQLQLFTDN